MSTFFEKLTSGAASKASAAPHGRDGAPKGTYGSSPLVEGEHEERAASTRLHVAPDEVRADEDGVSHEEEGELTLDIYDRGDAFVIQSTVAGVKPEDLDVSITNDTIAIKGKRERIEDIADTNYYYKELFWGPFSRSVILPEEVEEEAAEAHLKFGLLTLHLPKKKRGVRQKLKVKVS